MMNVLNRTTLEYIKSANEAIYPTASWIHDPDMSSVSGVPSRYWKIVGDAVQEMTAAEKDSNHLTTVQQEKMAEIDVHTTELILGGFEYPASSGGYFSLSMEAQSNLEGLHQVRDDTSIAYPVEWNHIDNADKLSLADSDAVSAFYLTALGVVRGHRDSGTSLKDQVRAATTVAAVEAISDNRT